MQVFVNYLGTTHCMETNCDSFDSFMTKVKCQFELEENFTLVSNMNQITDLAGLSDNQNLFVSFAVLGAGKKKGGKKRKAYTTQKKNKHKHQNVKLNVLNYYALKDGKAERVKKLCENESCKAQGIFMANHWNRYYCGRCHLTLAKINAPKEEPKKQKVVAKVEVKDVKADAAAAKKGGKKK